MKNVILGTFVFLFFIFGCEKKEVQTVQEAAQTATSVSKSTTVSSFTRGVDISWAYMMSKNGYTWKNASGVTKGLGYLFKDYNIQAVAFRVWVHPSTDAANGHCSPAEVASEARLYYNLGYKICICCHYGDTWNAVGGQTPPATWANCTYAQMKDSMVAHVNDVLGRCKALGVTPTWFKNGNESNLGVCGYVGNVNYNPAQMVGLFNACYDAAKAIFPNIIVITHTGQPQKTSAANFWSKFTTYGGKFDVMGVSSYAQSTSIPTVFAAIQNLQTTYASTKPLIQVEYGGPWNRGYTATSLAIWLTNISSLPNASSGGGVWYWEPEAYPGYNGGYTLGAVDSTGTPSSGILAAFN